jgi:hypothetical protein
MRFEMDVVHRDSFLQYFTFGNNPVDITLTLD